MGVSWNEATPQIIIHLWIFHENKPSMLRYPGYPRFGNPPYDTHGIPGWSVGLRQMVDLVTSIFSER